MFGSHKILIVDDDPDVRNVFDKLLCNEGYEVVTASDGRDAQDCITNDSISLVLLDICLPDMDGFQIMEYIRSQGLDLLVIVMTGEASTESAVTALRKGAYDYLRKPIVNAELQTTIHNAINYKKEESARRELELKAKLRTAEFKIVNQQLEQEIAERAQIEEELRESEQRFRNLVENSLIGISIIQDNQFHYQNPKQLKMYAPVSGKSILQNLENVHPDDLEKVKAAYQKILAGEVDSVETDFRFYPPGKVGNPTEMRWVQCQATSFHYHGKDAILVNTIDITKAKQLEQQLLIKNKMLSLGRVAAGIAHEIRNPLTGINSYLYTLEDLCRSEKQEPDDIQMMRQIVKQIQVASNKIESVIKRVMDFSKPGAPKMILTDINASVEEAIKLSAVTLRKHAIKIEKSLAQNPPLCYADPHLIEQVILNLVTNAAKAMKKTNGSKVIEVKSLTENNTLFLQVSDSGPGVPLELQEKIFDPFFTTKDDGSGIGLNIAQRIVADHHGSISLNPSRLGGAEFTVELPIDKRRRRK